MLARRRVIDPRQLAVEHAHRLDIEPRIFEEPAPLDPVCFNGGATQRAVHRARFAEKLDELLADLALGLIERHSHDPAQLLQ